MTPADAARRLQVAAALGGDVLAARRALEDANDSVPPSQRVEIADHYTPRWVFEGLGFVFRCIRIDCWSRGPWLDPCSGDGAFQRGIPRQWITNDPFSGHAEHTLDALEFVSRYPRLPVVTNPPFHLAETWLRQWVPFRPIVFLLPITWLQRGSRGPWLSENPPDVFVIPERIAFSRPLQPDVSSTDNKGYCWLHWPATRQFKGEFRSLPSTPREVRRG